MDALIGLGWPLSFGSSSLVFARFGVCPFLGVENLVLSLQDSRGVADALGAPLTYRLQGQNPLDVERVQLVGMRQGLEQLVQAPRQPPGIAHGIDELVKPEGRYYHFIQNRIEQAGCRTRRDSTRFVDTLITASPEFFKKKSPKEIQEFFQRAADFLIGRVGKENIVSAVVHMDEKTPHLHLVFVPLTEDNRLCAKEIIGNRANLTKWQDDFHAYMVEKYPDLERGESASKTGRKHIPTRLFKQAVNLSKQARAIEATLDGITPFNAGKKKEEALSLLKKWFPQMENFSGQLKKYKVTINDLLAENEQLEARAKASEKGKMKDTMERAKLESELHDIQRLVDRIPPEVLAELKHQQRHTRER